MFGLGIKRIKVDELAEKLNAPEKPLLLDVREPSEFEAGHVPGALNVPLAGVRAYSEDLDPEQEVLLICQSGNRSATAARRLKAMGFKNATSVAGGTSAWKGTLEL